MSGRAVEGAWYSRNGGERYATRGASVERGPGGWYAKCGRKVRGPLSSLLPAMEAADRMLAEHLTSGDGDGRKPAS